MKKWVLIEDDETIGCVTCGSGHGMCSDCAAKIHSLLVYGRLRANTPSGQTRGAALTLWNTTGGVPATIRTRGAFKCIACDEFNQNEGVVCDQCRKAIRRMRDD